MKWSGFNFNFWIPLLVIVAVVSSAVTLIATHPEGTLHHGIVGEEVCQGLNNYILIDFGNGSTHVYSQSESSVCFDFLYHHHQGVTVRDSAWDNHITWYKFDDSGVKP